MRLSRRIPAKKCLDCREIKPLTDYHHDKRRPDGRVAQCKPCRMEYRKRWYAAHREDQIAYAAEWKQKNRDRLPHYGRKFRHGITQVEYEAMVVIQDGACAVCGRRDGDLRVDHDHVTGTIRGLLCDRCNRGLGFFADIPERLEAAAAYLRKGGDAHAHANPSSSTSAL